MGMMFIGTLVFNLIPGQMLRVFTSDPQVIAIGTVGFLVYISGDGSHHHAGRGVLLPAVYGTTEVKSNDCI